MSQDPLAVRRLSVIVAAPTGLLDLPGLGVPGARARAERAVQSVLDQEDPIGTEVVVVDDGGPEGVGDHIASVFSEAAVLGRLRVVHTEGGRLGLGMAWNRGVSTASGSALAFLDARDWWKPGRLVALEPWLRRHDLVLATDGRTGESADWVRAFLAENPAVASSGIVRRALFDEIGGFAEGGVSQGEYEFWLRCLILLAKSGRRERFALVPNEHVVREARAELPVPLAGEVMRRMELAREAVSLLSVAPSLPWKYWREVASRVRGVGREIFRRR